MVGLVISDRYLLAGEWDSNANSKVISNITQIEYPEPITHFLYNEAGLNNIIASSLRKVQQKYNFSNQNIVVGVPDHFVEHSVVKIEHDLTQDDHMDYVKWIELQKERPNDQSLYIHGQIYFPSQDNIHICAIPRALTRTIRLSIAEMGGRPYWMGPMSTICLDGSNLQESALITRQGNKYSYLKVQNNQFSMGSIGFSGGVARIISSTDPDKANILSSLGLETKNSNAIPVFCAQKLGRQAKQAWELSDFRPMIPFDNMQVKSNVSKLPFYEANILSSLIKNKAMDYSFNFFEDEEIVEFFYDEVYDDSSNEDEKIDSFEEELLVKVEPKQENKTINEESNTKNKPKTSISSYALAVLVIVVCFIGINFLKLQDQINNSFFGLDSKFKITRSGIDDQNNSEIEKIPPLDLIKESRAISSSIIKLLTQTDLNRYNGLTITKSFLSMEYMSGVNPNIENILGLDPTSFTVEAVGKDSTIFLWYYSFELPIENQTNVDSGSLNKIDLMVQLDTTLTDYNLKYFEQVYTRNQIYGPLLVWVKGKADILQASAIIGKLNDDVLLRKFVLFNKSDRPNPKAGFYISVLED